MVRNQDDASFVSWTATLHPESAASTIDPRLQNESNPWATIYQETCADANFENMPVAFNVVAVNDDDDNDNDNTYPDVEANPQQPQERPIPQQHRPHDSDPSTDNGTTSPPYRPQPWKHSNLIDLIVGLTLCLGAFAATVKIEITAIVIYTLAAGFRYLGDEIFGSGPPGVGLLGKSICMTIMSVLMIVDAILLTVSVLVTEILGGIALLVCTLLGGPRSGNEWHQFIRRACHLTRWGFRNCHKGWKPDRIFPITMEDEGIALIPTMSPEDYGQDEHGYEVAPRSEPLQRSCSRCSSSSGRGACECSSRSGGTYYCDNQMSPQHTVATVDESTLTSSMASILAPPPAIAIAPENVQVVHEEEDHEMGGEDRHFIKNTQEVTIS